MTGWWGCWAGGSCARRPGSLEGTLFPDSPLWALMACSGQSGVATALDPEGASGVDPRRSPVIWESPGGLSAPRSSVGSAIGEVSLGEAWCLGTG